MSSQEYLTMMKDIQENILNFLEEEAKSEENFQHLEDIFNNTKISDNKYNLLSLLHLICNIADNYHSFPNFFSKIERILQFFKEDIKTKFSNSEIFNIFKKNKRILLFLIEQQLIVFDAYVVFKIIHKKFCEAKYPQYFQPEIQPFINEKWFPKYNPIWNDNIWVNEIKKELPENFYEKRREGENDNQIIKLIRNDMIEEFDTYVNQNSGISLDSKIQPSIYETNPFILKKLKQLKEKEKKEVGLSLIEYAAFYGSFKIFNYLRVEGVELTPSLWLLAIHGKNSRMIHFLGENHVELEDKSYKQIFYEAIKCHHNDIANHFLNNYLKDKEENSLNTINKCLKYYNFAFLKEKSINKSSFGILCKYDYCALANILMKEKVIDINKKEILIFC
ncbi:hypothetical protein M9Y10_037252 [Tritrichomonas musculus]|uniref:DUF3447 domain-containing protein n=1 Tax=Tritrichomonas musculus TaxID=1915356 RepID=A0ABR2GU75_9EUKA